MSARVIKVGICGTFDVENYGDLLFPLLAQRELETRLDRKLAVVPYSYHEKSASDWPYPVRPLAELPQRIGELDGLIIGGGDLVRFDKPVAPGYLPPSPDIHHPTGYWLGPALMGLQCGVPVIWNAVGAHGPVPDWAQPLLELALRNSRYVSARDPVSAQHLQKYAATNPVAVVPDTVFGLRSVLGDCDDAPDLRAAPGLRRPYVVVQATSGMQPLFSALIDAASGLRDHQILVLPVGPVHGDHCERLSGDSPCVIYAPAWPSPLALARLVAHSEGVLGSSLHLAITALACGVPVFRPQQMSGGKYAQLSNYQSVQALSERDIRSGKLVPLLGRRQVASAASSQRDVLRLHWDRIAGIVAESSARSNRNGRDTADSRLWLTLPSLLEKIVDEDRPVATHSRIQDRSDGSIMRLNTLRDARLREQPYRWGILDGLFAAEDARHLTQTFPVDHFKVVAGYDREKGYEYQARSLIHMGEQVVSHLHNLSPGWRKLAQDLLSPAYRDAMSGLTGMDLTGLPIEVNVFHYGQGAWLGPHVDLQDKLVTHVLYFNAHWNDRDGGCLNVLGSSSMDDVVAIASPIAGNSAVLVRSDNSWHAVSKVGSHCAESRKSVTVTFYKPGSVSSMWPPHERSWRHRAKRRLHQLRVALGAGRPRGA
jgi:lipopolysaccharide transport system ATP-binding protein